MAWAEQLPDGRWRGCYRDNAGRRCHVTDEGAGYEFREDAIEDAEIMEERI